MTYFIVYTMVDSNSTEVGFVVLIGLPGSGKTVFSKYLKDCLENPQNIDDLKHIPPCTVFNVCYDTLMPPAVQNMKFREARDDILNGVEKLVCDFKKLHVPERLSSGCKLSLTTECCHLERPMRRVLITIDDNMYYRSMRYRYFQLARYYGLGFCEFFIECDMDKIFLRNASRSKETYIPEDIIKRMAINMEPPDKAMYFWEENSSVVSSLEPFGSKMLLTVYEVIEKSLMNPVSQIESNTKDAEISRAVCSTSVLHQADVVIRKVIQRKISENKLKLNREQLRSLVESLNIQKKMLLGSLKQGTLVVPENVRNAIEKGNPEASAVLQEFLCYFLKNASPA